MAIIAQSPGVSQVIGYGLWVMGYGLWVMGYGLWVVSRARLGNLASGVEAVNG